MQTRSRDDVPADLIENFPSSTDSPTVLNKYEISCSYCNKVLYTDADNRAKWSRSIEEGIDNPFICDSCQSGVDEIAPPEH